jgi:hypothetical protein
MDGGPDITDPVGRFSQCLKMEYKVVAASIHSHWERTGEDCKTARSAGDADSNWLGGTGPISGCRSTGNLWLRLQLIRILQLLYAGP